MKRTFVCGVYTFLLFMMGCYPAARKPVIEYSGKEVIIIQQEHQALEKLNLLFVNADYQDTIKFQVFNIQDTIRGLECNIKYSCYFKYGENASYSFLEILDYQPALCKENLSFQQVKNASPVLNYVIQDFKQGSIYRLGSHGGLINEFDSLSGFIRGFDHQDSLLAWCSDSSQVTIKNLVSYKKRQINFDSTLKLHHDLILHYPFLTVLYNKKKYKKFKSFKVIEEGFIQVDLRKNDLKFWSIHDFLSDNNLPLANAKGSFVTAHGNSIDVDEKENYYISFRDFNQVWKISSDLSKVLYRIGLNADSFQIYGDYFVGQHSIDIIKPDLFYLFDNGSVGSKAAKSRIVRILVNVNPNVFRVKNILSLPDSLSTIRMGSVHGLDNSLVVSTYHNGLHILEIDTIGIVKNHLINQESHAIKVLPIPPHWPEPLLINHNRVPD